jgi:transcriptional regulator with XRE-family HTH domain
MLMSNTTDANDRLAYPEPMQTMGDRIRLLRQAKGWSQGQLAGAVGVTPGAISQWEIGLTKNVKLETFLRLCEALGTNPHYLIFGPSQPGTTPAGQISKRRPRA